MLSYSSVEILTARRKVLETKLRILKFKKAKLRCITKETRFRRASAIPDHLWKMQQLTILNRRLATMVNQALDCARSRNYSLSVHSYRRKLPLKGLFRSFVPHGSTLPTSRHSQDQDWKQTVRIGTKVAILFLGDLCDCLESELRSAGYWVVSANRFGRVECRCEGTRLLFLRCYCPLYFCARVVHQRTNPFTVSLIVHYAVGEVIIHQRHISSLCGLFFGSTFSLSSRCILEKRQGPNRHVCRMNNLALPLSKLRCSNHGCIHLIGFHFCRKYHLLVPHRLF
ncbi:uncharacterized protein M421DRAFT_189438 [Didymella exigua CBS 183.55]|uniref:Uncharacterized protein n=1 Tax=Didymella exigua CBS 183.55 TaxID=1150837 RepID=A0A6A5RFH1_9PLEO|nr:uncharacterized protein M421DRAFT_189438 [Didymella exigua CBS 183.55]KAF1927041.1 hypothetical protein M421DRAFT_189438 [Didymella exigua CBS 183.55]